MAHPTGPIVIDQDRTRAALAFPRLIGALREAFVAGAEVRTGDSIRNPSPR